MKRGKFLVFGGLDQTGKTTQSKRCVHWLKSAGIEAVWTCEPVGTVFGKEIKKLMDDYPVLPKTRLLLFLAQREEHLKNVILPNLERGAWVVCDRFFESTFLYQGAMGIREDLLWKLHTLLGHDIPVDLEILFTGKTGIRRKKDSLDQFCDENRAMLMQKIQTYLSHKKNPALHIHMEGQTEEEVERAIQKAILEIMD